MHSIVAIMYCTLKRTHRQTHTNTSVQLYSVQCYCVFLLFAAVLDDLLSNFRLLDHIKDVTSCGGYRNPSGYFWWTGELKHEQYHSVNQQENYQTQQQSRWHHQGHQSAFREELATSRTSDSVSEMCQSILLQLVAQQECGFASFEHEACV